MLLPCIQVKNMSVVLFIGKCHNSYVNPVNNYKMQERTSSSTYPSPTQCFCRRFQSRPRHVDDFLLKDLLMLWSKLAKICVVSSNPLCFPLYLLSQLVFCQAGPMVVLLDGTGVRKAPYGFCRLCQLWKCTLR